MSPSPATQTSAGQLYKRLLGYVKPLWKAFIIAAIGMAFVAATEAGFPALMKPMMDGTFVDHDPKIIQLTPIVLIALFLVRGTASFVSSYWMAWVARHVIKKLRSEIFNHLLRLPVAYFDATPSGNLLSKLLYDVEQVAQATTDSITILIRDTLTVIGLLGFLFYTSWTLAVILLLGVPLVAQLIRVINKRFRRYSTRIQTSMGDVAQIAEETIEGQRVVKAFGGQDYEHQRFDVANEDNRKLQMKMATTNAAAVPVVQFIAAMASAGVIYAALSMLETLSVGTFVSFIAAMMLLHQPMKRLTAVSANLQKGIAAADSIFSFIDTPIEEDRGEFEIARAQGRVSYRDIRFRYNDEKGDVLKGISFDIQPGQTVAFVGGSGSGKSTLVNLLPRFYDVQQGQILLDDRDIRDYRLANLRTQVSLVSQHITLFNDSIANNIAYGSLGDASREQVMEAAEAAHAIEFIRELPEGFETLVGENGVLLSGGQRQRLAIARALLKDSPILILDEATSALDTQSERYIQEALERLMENRTTLVIAHRLSTIEKADHIIVMDNGTLVEAGTHSELLAKQGYYANLYNMQFREETPPNAVNE